MSSAKNGKHDFRASGISAAHGINLSAANENLNTNHLTERAIHRSYRVMRMIIFVLLATPTVALADCPPLPERSERHRELMELVAEAPNEVEALTLNNELWEIWSTAPDEVAQQILQRGMERRAAFDFTGAIEDFDALIDYCPNYAEGYNQRAFARFLSGSLEDSLRDLDRTLEITPDHIGAVSGRALVLLALGREREGQLVLRDALKLNPWLPERHQLVPLENLDETEL